MYKPNLQERRFLGTHYIIEFYGCSYEQLNDPDFTEKALLDTVKHCGATLVSHKVNLFNPHGVSAFVVIAESHISVHTYPEYGYAAFDVFTCGYPEMTQKAFESLERIYQPKEFEVDKLERGDLHNTKIIEQYEEYQKTH